MKAIDLLNKIANSEPIPYKIKYNENIYYYDLNLEWYIREDLKNELFIDRHHLRDNIEIINIEITEEPQEHKIPEKLKYYISCGFYGTCKNLKREDLSNDLEKIGRKINEIIDYLEDNNANRYN